MRAAFSRFLVDIAASDENIVVLTGDHGYALFDDFRRVHPSKFINAGIAEQNMIGVAGGLAKAGFRPIVYGLSSFVPIRVLEQIKLDICVENLPVILIGDGAGLVYSKLGVSHQSSEDIASVRSLPNMTIFSPADPLEMKRCLELSYTLLSPVYLRIGKSDVEPIHQQKLDFSVGDILTVTRGTEVAILATGSMVSLAVQLAEPFKASIYSVPTLKPLDENALIDICKLHRVIITLEEHSIYGGLGSAVSEISSSHYPRLICRIGINDRFSDSIGSYEYLLQRHGLDLLSVRSKIADFLSRHGLYF